MTTIYSFTYKGKTDADACTRTALRLHYGAEAAQIRIVKDGRGRPFFENADMTASPDRFLSITDSGPFRLIGFSDAPFGIDLQRCTLRRDESEEMRAVHCGKLASRFYHPAEMSYVQAGEAISSAEVCRRFFRIWTAREAYVKYTGTGIDRNFSKFNVLWDFPELVFQYPEFRDGYILCVCLERGRAADSEIRIRDAGAVRT